MVSDGDYWTQRKLHDEAVRNAREALSRAVRITKQRAQALREAEDQRFSYVQENKALLDSCQSPAKALNTNLD